MNTRAFFSDENPRLIVAFPGFGVGPICSLVDAAMVSKVRVCPRYQSRVAALLHNVGNLREKLRESNWAIRPRYKSFQFDKVSRALLVSALPQTGNDLQNVAYKCTKKNECTAANLMQVMEFLHERLRLRKVKFLESINWSGLTGMLRLTPAGRRGVRWTGRKLKVRFHGQCPPHDFKNTPMLSRGTLGGTSAQNGQGRVRAPSSLVG